ncbi:MAG: hypothetical protein HY295_03025, partial [Thaumarchaeota archaeon]|nr:hypothetical protein [Nitrososphaerota archaeon]
MPQLRHVAILSGLLILAIGMSATPSFAQVQIVIPSGALFPNSPFFYSPSIQHVKTGETVVWENEDVASHTVSTGKAALGIDGRIDSGLIAPGSIFSYKFDKQGVYEYYCLLHPWMTGAVSVGDGSPTMPPGKISVSTDKPSYHKGDTILVSGQVSDYFENEEVTIWVTTMEGKGIAVLHVESEPDRTFSAKIDTNDNMWSSGESYKVNAQYATKSTVGWTKISLEQESSAVIMSKGKAGEKEEVASNKSPKESANGNMGYRSFHKIIGANSDNSFTVQSDRHLYKPGEEVKIEGSMWAGLITEIGPEIPVTTVVKFNDENTVAYQVAIQVKDNKGNMVADKKVQVDSAGDYSVSFTLPQDSQQGAYTVESKIQVNTGLLGILKTSTAAKLQTSSKFVVINPVAFAVKAADKDLNVKIASNSNLSNFEFKPEQKKVS